MILPPQLSGDHKLAYWLNQLRDYVRSITPQPSSNQRVRRTAGGTFFEQLDSGGVPLTISRYKYQSMTADYLVCHSWDGTTEGTTAVNIAKSIKLRHSITSEAIDGVTVTYSSYNTSAQTRIAGGGASETQIVVPRFLAGDVLYVITAPTGVTGVTLLDLNLDGRAWASL